MSTTDKENEAAIKMLEALEGLSADGVRRAIKELWRHLAWLGIKP